MSLATDPFDLEETGPPRDRWERPLLVPRAGGDRLPYTRMSTLANYIADHTALGIWEKQKLAIGLACREDICGMIAALPPPHDARRDKSTLTREEREHDRGVKKKLNEYIEMALEAAGSSYKANHGTAVHGFIEKGCTCQAPERMEPDAQSALDLFREKNVEVFASEVFVANDELQAAGSFDHLARWPGWGICITDVKTGQVDGKGLAFSVQLAGYANAQVYDWHDDTRAPLESLTGGEKVNRMVGVVVHVPLGGARTQPYLVDLTRGYQAAHLATRVRTARSINDLCRPLEL